MLILPGFQRLLVSGAIVFAGANRGAFAQYGATGTAAPSTRPAQGSAAAAAAAPAPATKPAFKQEELDQILAPLALYPDSLLVQVLMASTYPLEVVQANRWTKANSTLKGDALAAELNKQTWDASVKSLVNFPDVLAMMDEKIDWTMKLGDAFIAQQKQVMDTVQQLRVKAKDAGNLKDTKEQKVTIEDAPAATQPSVASAAPQTQIIKIESTSPDVIYVPTYNPTVVYGTWPYPSYPPAYYYPPGYVAGTAMLSFGIGVACGAAWGHAWGGCNWGHGDVDIDVNKNFNYNQNIDRSKAKAELQNRNAGDRGGNRGGGDGVGGNRGGDGRGSWSHNPSHRGGVSYRDQATAQKFGGASGSSQAARSREAYRGRAETGRQDISRGGADQFRSGSSAGGGQNRDFNSPSNFSGSQNRSGAASGDRASSGNRSSSAFDGVDRSGSTARSNSQRGQASRSSSSSGGSRSSGGGSRGGGGGGGSRGGGGGGRGGGGGGGRR